MTKQQQPQQKNLIDPAPGPYRDEGKQAVATRQTQPSDSSLQHIEELARKYALSACEMKGPYERGLILAEGMQALRQALKPFLPRLLPLMGSKLGFGTDRKGKEPYPDDVVIDCLAEATLRGFYPVGNEWMILGGAFYGQKEGYKRLVKVLPGLTDLDTTPGVPKMVSGGAIVPYVGKWKLDGKSYTISRDIPVRLNAGQGVDAAIGKAEKRLLAAIHYRCTGSFLTEGDAEDDALPALPPPRTNGSPAGPTREQKQQLAELAGRLKFSEEEFKQVAEEFGAPGGDAALLTHRQCEELLMHLEDLAAAELDGRDPAEVPG